MTALCISLWLLLEALSAGGVERPPPPPPASQGCQNTQPPSMLRPVTCRPTKLSPMSSVNITFPGPRSPQASGFGRRSRPMLAFRDND